MQHAEAVLHAAAEVDAAGFIEVLGGAGHFGNGEAVPEDLADHLVVEDEIVGAAVVLALAQHLGAVSAVAGVVLAELFAHQDVLGEGEQAVGDVFVQWHAALERTAAQDARSEDHGIDPIADHRHHGRDQLGGVLVVGVQHHHDAGAQFQGLVVAAFLVAAVAGVLFMHHDVADADSLGFLHGAVGAFVVHEHHLIHKIEGDLVVGLLQGVLGLIGGQHHNDLFALVHGKAKMG